MDFHRHTPTAAPIMLVEDDPSIAGTVTEMLEMSGHRVTHAATGARARAMVEQERPGLIVLDLMLPDVDGLVLCSDLAAMTDAPIMICSGTTRKRDAVLGLKLGADDFLAKPFDIYELEARVDALLRRSRPPRGQEQAPRAAAAPQHRATEGLAHGMAPLRVGNLEIDRTHKRAVGNGVELRLTPTEYRLLQALAASEGETLTRPDLAAQVWGYEEPSQGRSIDVHIRRLRMKLEKVEGLTARIESERGVGYRLTAA